MEEFERIVQINPAFDRRNSDPHKDYGIHCCDLRMILKGPKGAVQFVLYTGWNLKHVREERRGNHETCDLYPMPCDKGYHSPVPTYGAQQPMKDREGQPAPCEYLDGKPCYYDGSSLNAIHLFDVMCAKGSDGVWAELEAYYHRTFDEL